MSEETSVDPTKAKTGAPTAVIKRTSETTVQELSHQPDQDGEAEDDTLSTSSAQSLTPSSTLYSCSSKETTATTPVPSAPSVSNDSLHNTTDTTNTNHTPIVNWSSTVVGSGPRDVVRQSVEGRSSDSHTDCHNDGGKAVPSGNNTLSMSLQGSLPVPPLPSSLPNNNTPPTPFSPHYKSTQIALRLSQYLRITKVRPQQQKSTLPQPPQHEYHSVWIGFWALLSLTCANSVVTPMRDAVALAVGVSHLPKLTVASTVLALLSSVPIGWLFEAPDPQRRRVWKRMGLTRGETQGTSLALFYRVFAILILVYGLLAFPILMHMTQPTTTTTTATNKIHNWMAASYLWSTVGQAVYVAFFLVVHLMKLHSLSLLWGVITEAMEYEDVAVSREAPSTLTPNTGKTRLKRLSFVGFGGTVGGILGR